MDDVELSPCLLLGKYWGQNLVLGELQGQGNEKVLIPKFLDYLVHFSKVHSEESKEEEPMDSQGQKPN